MLFVNVKKGKCHKHSFIPVYLHTVIRFRLKLELYLPLKSIFLQYSHYSEIRCKISDKKPLSKRMTAVFHSFDVFYLFILSFIKGVLVCEFILQCQICGLNLKDYICEYVVMKFILLNTYSFMVIEYYQKLRDLYVKDVFT